MCLSFCPMLHHFDPIQPQSLKRSGKRTARDTPKYIFSHLFAHSLLTRSSSTRTSRSSGPQTAAPSHPRSLSTPQGWRRALIHLDVRRCAYWRSTAFRLRTSRKSQPDRSKREDVVRLPFSDNLSSSLCIDITWLGNEKATFSYFCGPRKYHPSPVLVRLQLRHKYPFVLFVCRFHGELRR